jgi:hypothetical protein
LNDFIGEGWASALQNNQLEGFDALWELDAAWFEEPNERRGGWSGVSRIELELVGGERVGCFLKRQENHVCKTPFHPFKGEPTFAREFRNIQRFKNRGVPSLEVIFYGQRVVDGKQRAILMTRELSGFLPLSSDEYQPSSKVLRPKSEKEALFAKVAELMRVMHAANFQHNCFYPKHVFVRKAENGEWDARVIDLEKVKWQPLRRNAILRDLYTLNRHSFHWPLTDRMRFFKIYRKESKLSKESKRIWRDLAAKIAKKEAKQSS